MSEPEMNFDSLSTIRVPVVYDQKQYHLQELSGEAVADYRDAVIVASSLPETEMAQRVKAMGDAEMALLSKGLLDASDNCVSVEVLKTWPHRVLKPMVKRLKQISEILFDDEDTPNPTQHGEPSDTPVGSK